MKKLMFSLIAMMVVVASSAQTPSAPSYKKLPTLSVNFFLKDMKTANLIDHTSLSSVLNNSQWTKVRDMNPGLGLAYYEGLTEHVDFMATLAGSYVKYPFSYYAGVSPSNDNKFLLESSANLNIKLLTDKYFLVPYFSFGVGASMYAGTYFAAYAPMGAGLQLNLGEGTFVHTMFGYNAKISPLATNHLTYSIGIGSPIKERKAAPVVMAPPPPPPAPVEKDTDGDGIVDSKDKCPTVPGVAKYDGCPVPDTDGDGINDENDKCPTVKGIAKYQGCPIPDTDKDGINDEEDKCPTVPGVARYQGCPIPDTDGDGVNDEEDKCPTEAGPRSNYGCPEIQQKITELSKSIYFTTASAKVMDKKAIKSLDEVAEILKKYTKAMLTVEGHTDNTGKADANKKLSQKRADSVKEYLAGKGVDASRITAIGYGSEKPIDTNKTPAGRAKNRRVELKASYAQ